MTAPLILASASEARATLLRNAGVRIEVDPARIDEDEVKAALRSEGVRARDQAPLDLPGERVYLPPIVTAPTGAARA